MRLPLLAFLTALALAGPLGAHGPSVGANGGRQVDAGAYHLEMTVEGDKLTVFVRDHGDRAVPTAGFRGTVILTLDGRAQRIVLSPDGENRMVGTAARALPAQPRGVVQVVNRAGASMQARFD